MTESKNDTSLARRLLLYGGAAVLAGGLVYAGFIYPKTVSASPLTLLGIARLHLGLAQVIPEHDKDGKPVPFRADHLAKAQEALDKTEAVAPGLALTREFRAFKAWIEGDLDASARWYREVLAVPGNQPVYANKTLVNLAQVEIDAGRTGQASAELEKVAVESRDARWHLTAAHLGRAKGDVDLRSKSLADAAARTNGDEKLLRQIADTSFQWGDGIALSCYERLESKDPVVWYRIARLKMAAGDPDSAGNALSNVKDEETGQLRDLFTVDAEFWEPHRDRGFLARFTSDRDSGAASPGK